MNDKLRNLPVIFNYLYDSGYIQSITQNEQSIIWGILFKLNRLRFPEFIEISNTELSRLTNLTPKQLHNAREKLLKRRTQGELVISYKHSGSQRLAGKYYFNYALMWNSQGTDEELTGNSQGTFAQNDTKNGNDHNNKQTNKTNIGLSNQEKVKELIKRYCPSVLNNLTETKKDQILQLQDFEFDHIEPVMKRANREGKGPNQFLGYVLTGLDHYDEWYSEEKPQPTQELTGEMAEKEQAFHQARAFHFQHRTGVWKQQNMQDFVLLQFCDKLIAHFEKYGQELIDAVGYDKSYWEAVRDNIKGGAK